MNLRDRKLRWLWISVGIFATFLGIAAVGWFRARHDIEVMRVRYRQLEIALRSKIDQVGDGVPLEVFKQILPNACHDPQRSEWIVFIPTGYDENPACTNKDEESRYFKVDGDVVKPVEFKIGIGGHHYDRFGPRGVLYYFWRAWYSTIESDGSPSP